MMTRQQISRRTYEGSASLYAIDNQRLYEGRPLAAVVEQVAMRRPPVRLLSRTPAAARLAVDRFIVVLAVHDQRLGELLTGPWRAV